VFARCRRVCRLAGAHGWNVDGFGLWFPGCPPGTPPPLAGGWLERRPVGGSGVFWHTVGSWDNRPGATGWWCWFFVSRFSCALAAPLVPCGRVVAGRGGLLFGNCIVDASILQRSFLQSNFFEDPATPLWVVWFSRSNALLGLFVVKFSRAHGGCLGIGSRRRTWESAISLVESITGR
jgi:hypothetical protein